MANSADGVQVDDATDNGIEVNGVTNWEGYFAGDINVTGSCTGCLLATFAINGGDRPLQKGEVVALQTLQSSTGNIENLPVSLAVVPASKGQAVIGVVAGRGELVSDDDEGSSRTLLVPREGTAVAGEYVHLIIYGFTQVQALGPVASGQRLTANDNGLTRSLQTIQIEGVELAENLPTIGLAMEDLAAGENQLIWVLVNIH